MSRCVGTGTLAIVAQIVLRTSRIQLLPLRDDHLEFEIELDADPEVMRYLGRPRQRAEVEQAHQRRLAAASRVAGLGFWVGLVDGIFVGWWILEPPHRADQGPADGQAELGYRLLRRYWRRGLASEGARELVRYGFEDLGLHRIFAETMAVNLPSRATMTSVGLTYVRTFHLDFDDPLPGSQQGEVEYAITREQWLANRVPVGTVENGGSVRLRKIKRPGGAFWFDLQQVLQDSDGTWLRGRVGASWGAPHERGTLSVPVLALLAAGRPWVAWWVDDPADPRLVIDVCLPPEVTEAGWQYVDLELDPVLHRRDSRVEIEDWAEYEQARRDGWMSADDAKLARLTAEDRAEELRIRAEPWQERGWRMVRQL